MRIRWWLIALLGGPNSASCAMPIHSRHVTATQFNEPSASANHSFPHRMLNENNDVSSSISQQQRCVFGYLPAAQVGPVK
jgi:hypothetical protein